MRAMPVGSLGFCTQRMFSHRGIAPLQPENKLKKVSKINQKEEYLNRRLRRVHNTYYLVFWIDLSIAGETVVQDYNAISQHHLYVLRL